MRLFCISVIIAAAMSLISCKDEVAGNENSQLELTGIWTLKQYEDTITVMKRSERLKDDNYGFIIKPGGVFIERKNTSWCGTPPVVYANYQGTWEVESDSAVKIKVGYWGGIMEGKINILALSDTELKFYYVPVR